MSKTTADQHLSVVQHILERSGRAQRPTPYTYLIWALASAVAYLGYVPQLAAHEVLLFNLGDLLLLAAYALTAWEFFRLLRDRVTTLDRQALFAFAGVTLFVGVMKIVWYAHGIMIGADYGIAWSMGFALSLILLGIGPMRPLLIGGLALTASIIIGSLYINELALVLAIGSLLGIGGPGLYFLMRRRNA